MRILEKIERELREAGEEDAASIIAEMRKQQDKKVGHTVSTRLDVGALAGMEELSRLQGKSISEIIRELIIIELEEWGVEYE